MGRLGWQEVTGYGKRALVESTMGRYKSIVGTRLRARDWRGQRTEAAIGVAVLNRMLAAGRPNWFCRNNTQETRKDRVGDEAQKAKP